MHIHVISSVNEARTEELQHKTVIVIDVLRATSTMLTALANGCRTIVPVETVNQAKSMQGKDELLGGERFCKKNTGLRSGELPAGVYLRACHRQNGHHDDDKRHTGDSEGGESESYFDRLYAECRRLCAQSGQPDGRHRHRLCRYAGCLCAGGRLVRGSADR